MGVYIFYLLIIIGSPWWADGTSMGEFSNTHVSPVVTYVGRLAGNVKAGPPCWCNFWTCAYCPGDTYCTVDESGCCPEPGCKNGCGRLCLCPSHPVCCPDGTCTKDYPTCCGQYCCKSDGNCCEEEHCCDAGNSCCGNGCCPEDNGQCCTSATDKETVCCVKQDIQLEEGDREKGNEEHLAMMDKETEDIFKYLCKAFNPETNKVTQYAVLVVGKLSVNYKLIPDPSTKHPKYDSEGFCYGVNYAAAEYKGGKHTEIEILARADNMINAYKDKYHQNPELFLFSNFNPCCGTPLGPYCQNGCAGAISKKMIELTGIIKSMLIAWDYNYKLGPTPFDKAFLFSLNSMLTPENTRLAWNIDGFCRKEPRRWFQEDMYNCLLPTAQSHPFCTEGTAKRDLARLINKVTWICGTSSTIEDEHYPDPLIYDDYDDGGDDTLVDDHELLKGPPAREPDCWKNNVASLDAYKCSPMPAKAFECATHLKERDLGPALLPFNPSAYSNLATDVRGDYGTKKLCFQSGTCKAPGGIQDKQYKRETDQRKTTDSKDEL